MHPRQPRRGAGRPPLGYAARKIVLTLDEPVRRWLVTQQQIKTPFGTAYMSTTAIVRGVLARAMRNGVGRRKGR
jgi:hypothetical protein